MIVVGIDGATWDVILPNIDRLPAFQKLIQRYSYGVLECDVRPVHSAPSWTTIFSGQKPEQHGITDFILDKAQRQAVLDRNMFIWQKVKDAVCLDIPVSFPPLNSGIGLPDWDKVVLSVTDEEMFESTKITLAKALELLGQRVPNLFSVVFYETDRAQHFYWTAPDKLLLHYQSIDSALQALMPFIEQNDFLILSDHGFTHSSLTRAFNWDKVKNDQPGGHHPYGIAISNRAPPKKITEVYDFMLECCK